ncbi:serine hydrolase [Kribbella sp. NPDC000426]|uniref:serine hydrolase domain-containing protein n=1 Tax=Kribbella sp. NPDC000426 TaxID=3154255 RepID=UPI003331B263
MLWPGTLPTQRVSRGDGPVRVLPARPTEGLPALADTHTDAFVIAHDGVVLASGGVLDQPQALFSIAKSVVGCVAAILVSHGRLSLDALVTSYVPELAGSGYAGATVRHVLDMRSGVRFVEDYSDPESDVRRLDQWLADKHPLYEFLTELEAEAPHGSRFLYRSAESDVLGWVCERAGETSMAQLVSELVWAPMGAEHDAEFLTDARGTAVHDGGLAATALDVARFGLFLLDAPKWLRRAWAVDAATRTDFLASPAASSFPGGWYRNQFWFRAGPSGNVLLCLGIHGQMLYVGRRTRTVCVKLSSWPDAQHPAYLQDTLRTFDAIAPRPRSSIL